MAKARTHTGQRSDKHNAGFGLVEALVVMLILGVISAIALPSFQSIRASSDLRSTSSDLAATITLARTQAVTLRVEVELMPLNNDWSNGWEVTYDWPVGATEIEDDLSVVKSGSVTIVGPQNGVLFRSSGIVSNGAVTFDLCREGWGRDIQVTPLGRVTIEETSC